MDAWIRCSNISQLLCNVHIKVPCMMAHDRIRKVQNIRIKTEVRNDEIKLIFLVFRSSPRT